MHLIESHMTPEKIHALLLISMKVSYGNTHRIYLVMCLKCSEFVLAWL